MLSPISSYIQPQLFPVRDEETPPPKKKCSPLWGEIMPSGEKLILASNLVLIITAVAYTFFSIKLPLLSIGLALYGIVYLSFNGRVKKGSPTSEEVARLKERIEELNGKNVLSLTTKSLAQQHQELLSKSKELQAEIDELEKDIRKKKEMQKECSRKIKQKNGVIQTLNQSIELLQSRQKSLHRH